MRRTTRTLALCSLALTTALACATTQTADQQWRDSNLTTNIGGKFAVDQEIDRYRIDIDTLDGVVTLRGVVPDATQAREAERIARWTEGVVRVDNQLEVDPNVGEPAEGFEDAWMTLMVGNKLNLDPEVKGRNVDVDVRDGIVTLSGIVEDDRARAEARERAASVDGVEQVINELEVAG